MIAILAEHQGTWRDTGDMSEKCGKDFVRRNVLLVECGFELGAGLSTSHYLAIALSGSVPPRVSTEARH